MTSIVDAQQTSLYDTRPTDFVYALMSNHVYKLPKVGDVLTHNGKTYPWVVRSVKDDASGWFKSGYFSALYHNEETNHYVLAHRGTNDKGGVWEDFRGIFAAKNSTHKQFCFNFVRKMISEYVKEDVQFEAAKPAPRISFTGHSLGAFLAELSVYICSMDQYDKSLPHVNAVTFESPGSFQSMEAWKSNSLNQAVDLTALDIVSYASYPNVINTFDIHVGSLYHIEPKLSQEHSIFSKMNPAKFTMEAHSMEGLLEAFNSEPVPPKRVFVVRWPCGLKQQQTFFKNYTKTNLEDGSARYMPNKDAFEEFKEVIVAGYLANERVAPSSYMPKIQFDPELFEAVEGFSKWFSEGSNQKLIDEWQADDADKESQSMKENMKNFVVAKNRSGKDSFLILLNGNSVHEFREWVSRDTTIAELIQLMESSAAPPPRMEVNVISGNAKVKTVRNSKAVGYQFPDTYDKDVIQEMIERNPINVAILGGNCEVDLLEDSTAVGVVIDETKYGFAIPAEAATPEVEEIHKKLKIKTNGAQEALLKSLAAVAEDYPAKVELDSTEKQYSYYDIKATNENFATFRTIVDGQLKKNKFDFEWVTAIIASSQ